MHKIRESEGINAGFENKEGVKLGSKRGTFKSKVIGESDTDK